MVKIKIRSTYLSRISTQFRSMLVIFFGLVLAIHGWSQKFESSIYIDANVIGKRDISMLDTVYSIGQKNATIYDRRIPDYVDAPLENYQVKWKNGGGMEIWVTKELIDSVGQENTWIKYVHPFAYSIGQLPNFLLKGIQNVVLIKGKERWSASNGAIYIHVDDLETITSGFLEESLLHEGGHASIDNLIGNDPKWLEAKKRDSISISRYGAENEREDLTESVLAWLGVRYRARRISPEDSTTIVESMPNRLTYLDQMNFDVSPLDTRNDFDYLYMYKAPLEDEWDMENEVTIGELFDKVKYWLLFILVIYVCLRVLRYLRGR